MSTTHHTAIATGAAANAATVNAPLGELDAAINGDIGARVYNNANISIPDATVTAITFNSERYDTDGIHSTTTNTSRLTCNTAGKYAIFGSVELAASATGLRYAYIRKNGSAATDLARINGFASAATACIMNINTIASLDVGDYVELLVFQNSTGALNATYSTTYTPEFAMQLIGRE